MAAGTGIPAPRVATQPTQPPLGQPAQRSTLDIPVWIYDGYLVRAKPVAVALVLALFRHGRDVVSSDGNQRRYWHTTLAELGRATGSSKPHLIAAEHWLAGEGVLRIHEQQKARGGHGISAPTAQPNGHNLLPVLEPTIGNLVVDDLSMKTRRTSSTTRGAEVPDPLSPGEVTICNRLSSLGVAIPVAWLAEFGGQACDEAADMIDSLPSSARLTNPPGLMRRWLQSPRAPAAPKPTAEPPWEPRYRTWDGQEFAVFDEATAHQRAIGEEPR